MFIVAVKRVQYLLLQLHITHFNADVFLHQCFLLLLSPLRKTHSRQVSTVVESGVALFHARYHYSACNGQNNKKQNLSQHCSNVTSAGACSILCMITSICVLQEP